MSAMASRVNSPPSRQISSPKYSPTKYLSPQGSSYYAKHQQKQGHKSPIANREKPSPTKNLDTKSTFSSLVSPTGAKKGGHHRHQTSTTITGKNPQKVDRQKTSTDTENVVPLDSRLERKDRKSDQHVMFPTYETEMPTKHKSCSMNGVSVPQELLLSPGSYENSVTAGMMSKKAQSTKHWNLQAVENMDLVTIYNKQTEARKKLNTPEGSPPSKSKTLLKNKFKTTKVSPRVYELLVGSPAKQGVQKVKSNNYVKEALKDVSGIRRNGGRTGSVPNEEKGMMQGDYNEISKSPSRAKTTKYSEPNIYEDVNVYNSLFSTNNKKGSEHHVKSVQPAQDGKGDYVFSTRSAVELQETEEKGYDEDAGDQLISELMKGHALKEIKLNPNAKFLTLRKQVQERRNKMGFKSVDWNGDENIKKMLQQNRTSPTKACESSPSRSPIHSPHVMRSVEVSGSQIKDSQNLASTVGKGDDAVTKEQLMHLFQKTKVILDSYKNKECDWEKERKLFIAEIMHLRGLLEQGCDS